METLVEDFFADLQASSAGLERRERSVLLSRAASLAPALEREGMAGFAAELLDDSGEPSIPGPYLDLEAGEADRLSSYESWRKSARGGLPALWAWLERRRGPAWWCAGAALPPSAEAVETLRRATLPVAPIGPIALRWAGEAGIKHGAAEHNWRWLALGRGMRVQTPAPPALLKALVGRFRTLGLLPSEHRVDVIRRPNSPSMVLPVRLPGRSILSLPSSDSPVSAQYIQHELAHLAEHAARPPQAPLAQRWSFDPVRSEGLALLFELVLQDPRWLTAAGFDDDAAAAVSAFYREEERFSKGLMAADLALDERFTAGAGLDECLALAEELAARLGLEWAPEIMLFRLPRALNWRSYAAGWRWRDAANEKLRERFGPDWTSRGEAWDAVRGVMRSVGGAGLALKNLGETRIDR